MRDTTVAVHAALNQSRISDKNPGQCEEDIEQDPGLRMRTSIRAIADAAQQKKRKTERDQSHLEGLFVGELLDGELLPKIARGSGDRGLKTLDFLGREAGRGALDDEYGQRKRTR